MLSYLKDSFHSGALSGFESVLDSSHQHTLRSLEGGWERRQVVPELHLVRPWPESDVVWRFGTCEWAHESVAVVGLYLRTMLCTSV